MFCVHFLFYLFIFWNIKKNVGYIFFWFYLYEPRSSQAIEPLGWDLKLRLFQDPSRWATESWFKALSHDPSKPRSTSSQNPSLYPLWAEIRAIEPRYKPSRVEPRYLSYSFVAKFKVLLKLHLEFEGEC